MPPSPLIALRPMVPSVPVPEKTMQTELDFVLVETVRLSDQVVRFDNFLDGLSELMRVISDTELVE